MRKIKFRGYRNGHYQYGVGTYEWRGKNYLVCRDNNRIYATEIDEPAAQYIGLDKNGVEVYEGDELADNRGDYYGDSATVYIRAFLRHTAPSTGKNFDYFWSKNLVDSWEVVRIEND